MEAKQSGSLSTTRMPSMKVQYPRIPHHPTCRNVERVSKMLHEQAVPYVHAKQDIRRTEMKIWEGSGNWGEQSKRAVAQNIRASTVHDAASYGDSLFTCAFRDSSATNIRSNVAHTTKRNEETTCFAATLSKL